MNKRLYRHYLSLRLAAPVSAGCYALQAALMVSCGLLAVPALAEPVAREALLTGNLLARGRQASVGVKELLQESKHGAVSLQELPPLWNWTEPSALGQAVPPTSVPKPAADPATEPPVAQVPAAPAEDAQGDFLDEVSVTATRRATRERDTTATTYAIKREDFQAQGATTVTSALQLVPGFTGFSAQGGAGGNGFFLRGFDDQRFQLLRDGISIQRPANGRTDISRFSLENLERVEVVNGGATLRYGSGSVGGVVNLITETPKGPPKITLKYETGSYGYSRYVAKFGGGDDTFSYNFLYEGVIAFNQYPYSFTLPNSAQFYGPTVNENSTVPSPRITAANYPNGKNSFGVGGLDVGDPANSGNIDLFGYLKPEVGPPIKVSGLYDVGTNSGDTYAAKLVFKPDAFNKLTMSLNQQNYKVFASNPGSAYRTACFGGASVAANPTLALSNFLPVDPNGNQLACDQQRYVVRTATSTQALPYNYNTSLDGSVRFPTGQAYPLAEVNSVDNLFFAQSNQSQTDLSLQWDYDITPTTSLNSYVAWYQFVSPRYVPQPFLYDSNIYLGQRIPGPPGERLAVLSFQPFVNSPRLELQSALTTQLSPGQTLSFGLNYAEDSSYQQPTLAAFFFNRAISRTSAFIVDDISFSDELKANLGFRYTYSTQFGSVGTPAIGLRYSPSSLVSLRANWSQVYSVPAPTNLFTFASGFIANPDLGPETGITYDIGADITPAPNLAFRLTYYKTTLDGFISTAQLRNPDATNPLSPTFGFNFLTTWLNLNSRYASGIEFSGDWKVNDQWRVRVVWNNSDVRQYGLTDDISQSTFPFFYQYQDPLIPFNNVVSALTYANRGLSATLLGRYNGGQRRANATDFTPALATLDLNVEIPLTPIFTLTGNVYNLTDTQYELIPGVPAPGTTFRVGGRFDFGV
ncbi:MAG: TonB-dependent receptor [Aphanocapsa lilacina HA4352-LM1]|jgi:iron complex outermembrane receptor protein|nr:TonB-dependent receptor [Aphanocapsa lilacina HA4352-LM1]